jgi:SlyX protein
MVEERLIDIEIKLSRQEDLLETLNQLVYQQRKKIDELEALCSALARHVNTAQDSGPSPAHELPPHY